MSVYSGPEISNDGLILCLDAANSNAPLYIGYTLAVGEQAGFNGNISQVSIYNRALSAQEISQNFNATRGRYGI